MYFEMCSYDFSTFIMAEGLKVNYSDGKETIYVDKGGKIRAKVVFVSGCVFYYKTKD